MARAEDRAESASDEDDALSGSSGDDSDSNSGSDYDSDSSAGGSNSDGSEDGEEGEDEDDEIAEEAAKQLVRADIDEMRAMIADMDAVKARLQKRFAAERQARLERIAREEHEREVQDADRRKVEQEAHGRHVETAVQTETLDLQQQTNLPQQGSCPPPHLADGACVAADTLPAVDGGSGHADAAPNKRKPAGLSLYDLVKASGFRKESSPVRQADPTRASSEHEVMSPDLQQQQLHYEQPESATRQGWGVANSRLAQGRDSTVNGHSDYDGASDIHSKSNRARQQLQSKGGHTEHLDYDENSSSMSNSLASSTAGKRPALLPDPVPRQDHKLNAAALLSSRRRDPTASLTNDKTDEQREMEAIQCLLFGRRGRP